MVPEIAEDVTSHSPAHTGNEAAWWTQWNQHYESFWKQHFQMSLLESIRNLNQVAFAVNINISEHIYKMHLLVPFTTALGHDRKSKNTLGRAASRALVHNNISSAISILVCTKFSGSGYDVLPRQGFRKTVVSDGHFGLRTL